MESKKKIVKCLSLTEEQCKELKSLSETNGCSESYIIRRAFDDFVKGLEPLEDNQ